MTQSLSIKGIFYKDAVKNRFAELLGRNSQGFLASIIQVVNNNDLLRKADPQTVLTAAATAAILDLPINQNLGFAYIVPYKGKAQFQVGWKGLVQLAQRTGQYEIINTTKVYKNQFKSFNSLYEELDADFSIEGTGEVVGYVAYFRRNNGFRKTVFWTTQKVNEHAKKYSKSYDYGSSPWKTDFDAMALKTVLKNMLSKWGLLSIEMQSAVIADQSVQHKEGEFTYPDSTVESIELVEYSKERQEYEDALTEWISVVDACSTIPDFNELIKPISEIPNKTLKTIVGSHFRQALKEKGYQAVSGGKEIVNTKTTAHAH